MSLTNEELMAQAQCNSANACYQPYMNYPSTTAYQTYPYYYYYPASSQQIIDLQKEVAELKDMLRQCLKELLYLAR